jgi:hypothetical protein
MTCISTLHTYKSYQLSKGARKSRENMAENKHFLNNYLYYYLFVRKTSNDSNNVITTNNSTRQLKERYKGTKRVQYKN